MEPKKICIMTYGCTANKNDSETMATLLEGQGHEVVKASEADKADYIIVNTCGVKATTENKIIHRLSELSRSGKKVVVGGCLTKINRERIEKAIPNYAAILDTNSVGKISDIVNKTEIETGIEQFSETPGEFVIPSFSFNECTRTISISQGCLSNCTFCGTKLSRGNLKSYRPDAIRDAVKRSVSQGFKEIQLTSQDVSAYGRDIDTNIAELLSSLVQLQGEFFIRVGMMNPLHFKKFEIDDLLEAYDNEKAFKFLHIPVQSGSNRILKDMKRGHTAEDFLDIASRFRNRFKDLQLWTDIIVAYPGETDSDFEDSLKLVRQAKPDFVHISRFSVRNGTEAAKLKKVDSEIAKERSRIINEECKKAAEKRNKYWIGWYGKVIITEYDKNRHGDSRSDERNEVLSHGDSRSDERNEVSWTGRNHAYKAVIIKDAVEIGDVVEAEITGLTETGTLVGKVRKV